MMNRALSEQERVLIGPELSELHALEQQRTMLQDRLRRMLTLIEPRMGEEGSGVTFDIGSLSFMEQGEG